MPDQPHLSGERGVRSFTIGGGWGSHVNWLNEGRAKPVGLEDGTLGQGPRRVYGHMGKRPNVGDHLTCEMQSGRVGVFVFTEVKYEWDPPDMFFGTVEFMGYAPSLSGAQEATDGR
jgi:hypothetical protein